MYSMSSALGLICGCGVTVVTASAQMAESAPVAMPRDVDAAAQTQRTAAIERTRVLGVGDEAPPAWIAEWLKDGPDGVGAPSDDPGAGGAEGSKPWRAKGTVTVVEFWATWCAPCRRSMDMLTKLQAGSPREKLRVVGICGTDSHGETLERVQKYLVANHARIGYAIAFDEDARTREAWLGAARIMQIPAAFVVTPEGLIAWIGNPATSGGAMKRVVDELLAGTFDLGKAISAARVERERKAAALERAVELQGELRRAMEADDAARVAEVIDALVRLDGERYGRLVVTRFEALRQIRPADAWRYAKELVNDRLNDDEVGLAALVIAMCAAPAEGTAGAEAGRDLGLALVAATRACELSEQQDSGALEALATVRFARKELAEAIAAQRLAVNAAPTTAIKKRLQERLEEYERAGQAGERKVGK